MTTVYALQELKNATDDALTNYLTSIKIRQSHSMVDKRLTLGYTAAVIAAMTFYADWKFGFEKLKLSIALAVVVFSILNTAFTLWLWKVEGDEVFRGVPSGQTRLLKVSSKVLKYDPTYRLNVQYDKKDLVLQAPFATWFRQDGTFVAQPFQSWLAKSVPLVRDLAARK